MKAALLPIILSALTLAACAPATKAPSAPAAAPRPAASPALPQRRIAAQTILQAPPGTDWIDTPLTPGAWRYIDYGAGNGKRALFSQGDEDAFDVTCVFEPEGPQILLIRNGQPPSERVPMTIRTETEQRTLMARAATLRTAIARLPVADPLLDAMALSKGRFAVEVFGVAPLYLPSHAEVSRVIEDCR
jgi:hypothetical protein